MTETIFIRSIINRRQTNLILRKSNKVLSLLPIDVVVLLPYSLTITKLISKIHPDREWRAYLQVIFDYLITRETSKRICKINVSSQSGYKKFFLKSTNGLQTAI